MIASDVRAFEAAIDGALARFDLTAAESAAEQYRAAADGSLDPSRPAHSPGFRALYLSAQVALAAGRLRRCLDLVSPLLPLTDALPPNLARRLYLLAAEACARDR